MHLVIHRVSLLARLDIAITLAIIDTCERRESSPTLPSGVTQSFLSHITFRRAKPSDGVPWQSPPSPLPLLPVLPGEPLCKVENRPSLSQVEPWEKCARRSRHALCALWYIIKSLAALQQKFLFSSANNGPNLYHNTLCIIFSFFFCYYPLRKRIRIREKVKNDNRKYCTILWKIL